MNEYKPPHIDPKKLDFSQWHPLDHRPLSKRCREHYGGFRNHMQLLWYFKWEVPSKIYRITHCLWGRHDYSPWFKGDGIPGGSLKYAGHQCSWCLKDMPESLPED